MIDCICITWHLHLHVVHKWDFDQWFSNTKAFLCSIRNLYREKFYPLDSFDLVLHSSINRCMVNGRDAAFMRFYLFIYLFTYLFIYSFIYLFIYEPTPNNPKEVQRAA